jgi:ferric-dicitrate binding protein FerR (iron transport regulator)
MKIDVKEIDVESYITWKEGWYKLDKLTFSELAKKLESYYGLIFIIKDKEIEMTILSGKLDLKEDVSKVLENISVAAAIDYTIKEDTIRITKKPAFKE